MAATLAEETAALRPVPHPGCLSGSKPRGEMASLVSLIVFWTQAMEKRELSASRKKLHFLGNCDDRKATGTIDEHSRNHCGASHDGGRVSGFPGGAGSCRAAALRRKRLQVSLLRSVHPPVARFDRRPRKRR